MLPDLSWPAIAPPAPLSPRRRGRSEDVHGEAAEMGTEPSGPSRPICQDDIRLRRCWRKVLAYQWRWMALWEYPLSMCGHRGRQTESRVVLPIDSAARPRG